MQTIPDDIGEQYSAVLKKRMVPWIFEMNSLYIILRFPLKSAAGMTLWNVL